MQKVSAILVLILIITAGCAPRSADSTSTAATAPATDTAEPRLTATPEPTLTPTATIVAIILPGLAGTPFAFPSAIGSSSVCESAPPTYLILHERGQVTNEDPQPLNIRSEAGLAGRILAVLHSLDIFLVIDGPRCADDYTWFKVRSRSVEGWIAEGEPGLYYVEPYLP
jgi:hypothetical protein